MDAARGSTTSRERDVLSAAASHFFRPSARRRRSRNAARGYGREDRLTDSGLPFPRERKDVCNRAGRPSGRVKAWPARARVERRNAARLSPLSGGRAGRHPIQLARSPTYKIDAHSLAHTTDEAAGVHAVVAHAAVVEVDVPRGVAAVRDGRGRPIPTARSAQFRWPKATVQARTAA